MGNVEKFYAKPVVVFHSVDPDGIYSAWCVHHFYQVSYIARKSNAVLDYVPWNYGEDINDADYKKLKNASVIIMSDATLPDEYMNEFADKIVWLDHHVAAIEHSNTQEWRNKLFCNYAEDGTAGCLLTWNFFFNSDHNACLNSDMHEPAPYFIHYVADYDVWNKENANVDYLNSYNRKHMTFGTAALKRSKFEALRTNFALINSDIAENRHGVLVEGRKLYQQKEEENEEQCRQLAWHSSIFGHSIAVANYTKCNSEWFNYIVEKHPDIEYLIGFSYSFATRNWKISAYNSSTNPEGNSLEILSKINDKYGDKVVSFGGHKGACGMIIKEIEPLLESIEDVK